MNPVDLSAALERGEVTPLFQPQFDTVTLALTGVEALARWRGATRGGPSGSPALHSLPDDQAAELDRQIFEAAVDACARLGQADLAIPALSVNVSAARLRAIEPAAIGHIGRAFGGTVVLELLETIPFETEPRLADRVAALRAHGFEIEVDDFGSGNASIVGLMRVRPDRLKIDRRLVQPIARSDGARRIAGAVMEIARALGIGVIAEGVETQEQVTVLRQIGCDRLQGNLLAAPMDEHSLEEFMRGGALCETPPV